MKSFSLVAACACAGAMYCGTSQAQGSLAAAVESAWQRSVQARSAAAEVRRAQAGQVVARSTWAAPPALELSHRGDPLSSTAGQREAEVGIAWPLLLPGQRSARMGAADADLRAAQAAEAAQKLAVAGEVREAAWNIVARRVEAEQAAKQARTLERLAQDVRRRVESGDLARTDLLAAQAEHAAAAGLVAQARQQLAGAAARWRALTGTEPLHSLEEERPAQDRSHPSLTLAELAVERARRRLDAVRAMRSEPPELMVRYRHDTPAANFATERSIGLALRIPFGTADYNAPRDAAALAELDIAEAQARRARAHVEAEAATARSAVAAAQEQVTAASTRAQLLRERAELLDKAFRAGETPLAELLRTVAGASQAESGLARQRAELGLARARLQQALGIVP